MLEAAVESHLIEYAKARGCLTFKLKLMGERGWPDRLIITPTGVHGYAETKRPKGGKVSPHQKRIAEKLIGNACNVAFPKTKKEAEHFVDYLLTLKD